YLGHAAFVLQFGDDLTVLTDYGAPNAWAEWGWDSPIHDVGKLVPDLATYSHTHHADHYDESRRPHGIVNVLKGWEGMTLNGVSIEPMRTSERSLEEEDNCSYLFRYRGLKVLHLGDCQANIMGIEDEANRKRIKVLFPESYDLLLMPIEGPEKFIPQAERWIREINPKRVIPMHYWSEAYKREFLICLERQAVAGERIYRIEEPKSAQYAFSVFDVIAGPVRVISLDAEPFSG
ncbi:MAG: MBL fold metallo-hydrolase, partial [Anaerolineae bacterium]|nr:MBL fold metallo-hydrolase [Anaerolineae bacterium]